LTWVDALEWIEMAEVAGLSAVIAENWNWQISGACRGVGDDLFFNPDNERGQAKRVREAGAKAVCATCPVIAECLDWALAVGEPYGVWGGKTSVERHELRRRVSYLAIAH
jgi:WhiB family transcriptional regulator, redox-sensing transcriptional regulator